MTVRRAAGKRRVLVTPNMIRRSVAFQRPDGKKGYVIPGYPAKKGIPPS